MSQNNTIRKSDKKFIRTEKARIRATFLDVKKQQELIDNLYKKFIVPLKNAEINAEPRGNEKAEELKNSPVGGEVKKEVKKPEAKKEVKKPKTKKVVA